MNVALENNLIRVVVSSHGAELQSILNLKTGHEYLWQGDERYWGRRSPVLFPIVGMVWDKTYMMDGTEYHLGQHGFARDCDFDIMSSDRENEAWFSLEWSDATYKLYPCKFRLEIGYVLTAERLDVKWRVVNLDSNDIYFQIGAHPAFNYPEFNADDEIHGYFNLDRRELRLQKIEDGGCVGQETSVMTLDEDDMIALTGTTFRDDVLIFGDGQVRRVSMLDKHRRPYLTLLFNAPVVGLWSPVSGEAPFVCIEPWWGRCDRVGYKGGFSDREYVNSIKPGGVFDAGYRIIVDDL